MTRTTWQGPSARLYVNASDSLDGIAHWWLVQQSLMKNRQLVEQALEQLVREGKLSKTTRKGQEAQYSAGPKLKDDEL